MATNNDDLNEIDENEEILENEELSEVKVTKQQFAKKLKIIAGIILVAILAVIVVSFWSVISPDKVTNNMKNELTQTNKSQGFPTAIVGTNIDESNFKLWDTKCAYTSDTSLILLNRNATKQVEKQISYATPILKTSGQYTITFNLGGKGFMIDTPTQEVYKSNSTDKEQNILTDADINEQGVYALLTQSSEYLSKLTVYNQDNTQKYAYYFSQHYATSVSLNKSGDCAIVSGVTADNGTMQTVVYVLDFSSEKPREIVKMGSNLPLEVSYLDNNKMLLVGDTQTVLFTNNDDKSVCDYKNLDLTAYFIDKNNGATVSLSRTGDKRNCNVIYISDNGNINDAIKTDLSVTDIAMYGRKTSLLSNGRIYVYDKNNNFVKDVDAGVDAKAICMLSEVQTYVLGVSEIRDIYL